jgi:hypothetical protein
MSQALNIQEARCDSAEDVCCGDHSQHEYRLQRNECDIQNRIVEEGRLHERIETVDRVHTERLDSFKNLLLGTMLSSLLAGLAGVGSLVVSLIGGMK